MAVVPGYYLVCYNIFTIISLFVLAVVPGYYLVCYNAPAPPSFLFYAVVPGYYLVCYNRSFTIKPSPQAVVPGYYLVCYNCNCPQNQYWQLQFPVITWYVIIREKLLSASLWLQFPVITWYVIIPVRAWQLCDSCSSRLLLGML